MKKIVITTIMLLISIGISAQEWQRKVIEADPMLGISETVMYEWKSTDCSFIMYDNSNEWSLTGTHFKPDPTHVNHRYNFLTYARIGFYSDDDCLIESWDHCKLELTNVYQTATSGVGRKKKGQYAVTNYLMNNTGYVRIVIPTIHGGTFDITIPCMKK
jgi:hypothetical protein